MATKSIVVGGVEFVVPVSPVLGTVVANGDKKAGLFRYVDDCQCGSCSRVEGSLWRTLEADDDDLLVTVDGVERINPDDLIVSSYWDGDCIEF